MSTCWVHVSSWSWTPRPFSCAADSKCSDYEQGGRQECRWWWWWKWQGQWPKSECPNRGEHFRSWRVREMWRGTRQQGLHLLWGLPLVQEDRTQGGTVYEQEE